MKPGDVDSSPCMRSISTTELVSFLAFTNAFGEYQEFAAATAKFF